MAYSVPLFWIVHQVDGEPLVYIKDASAAVYARLAGAMAGVLNPADFVEMHELDAKTARKVPKTMIGRVLSQREATALLKRMG